MNSTFLKSDEGVEHGAVGNSSHLGLRNLNAFFINDVSESAVKSASLCPFRLICRRLCCAGE
jgi:hypothetical protein